MRKASGLTFQLLSEEQEGPRRHTAPHRLQSTPGSGAHEAAGEGPGAAGAGLPPKVPEGPRRQQEQQQQEQRQQGEAGEQSAAQQAEEDAMDQALRMLAGESLSLGDSGAGPLSPFGSAAMTPHQASDEEEERQHAQQQRQQPGSEAAAPVAAAAAGAGMGPEAGGEEESVLVFDSDQSPTGSTDSLCSFEAPQQSAPSQKGMFGEEYPSKWRDPRCGGSVGGWVGDFLGLAGRRGLVGRRGWDPGIRRGKFWVWIHSLGSLLGTGAGLAAVQRQSTPQPSHSCFAPYPAGCTSSPAATAAPAWTCGG